VKITAFILVLAGLLLAHAPAGACVGIPDLDRSIIWQTFEGLATLLVNPDGSGNPLTEARTPDGVQVDATIHMTVITYCNGDEPVAGFPFEDMWLESMEGGLAACVGGSAADFSTDANGYTNWSLPLKAGGWDEAGTQVVINGSAMLHDGGLALNYNSPDINGDRYVNLSDLAVFSQDYYADFTFRSDFHRDGAINLSDVAVMASSMGISCP
jgi:hypothetical protein